MEKLTKRRLIAIAKKADRLAVEIRKLCESPEAIPPKSAEGGHAVDRDTDALVVHLRATSRDEAYGTLQKLSHAQLGAIHRKLGGLSQEAKKPKSMVIDRIMWTLFDFERGHDILKNGKEERPTTA